MADKWDRLVWALLLICATFTVGASRWLSPSASGMGTHEQLGLPPCGFLALFKLPCPACGLTTSFAHLAKFDLAESLGVHPMGLPLFLITLAMIPLSLHGLVRGMSVIGFIDRVEADRWSLWIAGATLATWMVRLFGACAAL